VLSSSPYISATEEILYKYDVEADDDDFRTLNPIEVLTYSLDTSPENMSIDRSTGMIKWIPTNEQSEGSHTVTIKVTDSENSSVTQIYQLNVININDPPAITSIPILNATEEVLYTYDIDSDDDDFRTLNPSEVHTYSIDVAPEGMGINSNSGLISWTPTNEQAAQSHEITVRVTDTNSIFDTQTFQLYVENVNDAPIANAGVDITLNESDTALLDGSETTDDDLLNPSGEILNFEWDFNQDGIVDATTPITSLTFNDDWVFNIKLNVTDKEGVSSIDTAIVTFVNVPPIAEIVSIKHAFNGMSTPAFAIGASFTFSTYN